MASDIIGAVGQVGGAIVSGFFSDAAAGQVADQIDQASRISAAAGAQARADILNTFDPAFGDVAAGIQGAINEISSGAVTSTSILRDFERGAGEELTRGTIAAGERLREGEQASIGALRSGFGTARQDLISGRERTLADLAAGIERGVGEVEVFAGLGETAAQKEAALSGALGPEAQQRAIDEFIESPGQQFVRKQQEESILRNAAATGGLGGGRVLSALQEEAFGRAATLEQLALENFRNIAGRGQQAGTFQGQLRGQGALTGAQIGTQFSSGLANLAAQQGIQESGVRGRVGAQESAIEQAFGTNLANLRQSTGGQISQTVQQTAANLANLLSSGGQTLAGIRTSAGTNLANLALGVGSQQANLAGQLGRAQAAGTLGVGSAFQQGLAGLAGLF